MIATASGTVLATIPTPVGISGTVPLELTLSPDGSHVYVFAPQARPNPVMWVVDTSTYLFNAVPLSGLGSIGPLLISPDGTRLYFQVGFVDGFIQAIDATTLKPTKQIPFTGLPTDIQLRPAVSSC